MRAAAAGFAIVLLSMGCASVDGASGPALIPVAAQFAAATPLSGSVLGTSSAYTSTTVLTGPLSSSPVKQAGRSAEPPDMVQLEQRPFNCTRPAPCETNWIFSEGRPNSMTIVQDPSAPRSAPNVAQMNYTPELTGGSGPANAEIGFSGSKQKSVMYISAWIKYSDNFQSHPTSINKELQLWIDGLNRIFTMAHGNGSPNGPLAPAFGLQGIAAPYDNGRGQTSTSVNLLPNQPGHKPILRGQWQHHEILLTANTPGVADGAAEMWLSGTKVLSYTNIMFVGANRPAKWQVLKWNPTWGGLGGTITTPFYMQMDDIYISGK